MTEPDPFDTLLTLEDTLYTTAYTHGTRDGSRAGRTEGRLFGLQTGFEKFAHLGTLHGRAVVWASQLQDTPISTINTTTTTTSTSTHPLNLDQTQHPPQDAREPGQSVDRDSPTTTSSDRSGGPEVPLQSQNHEGNASTQPFPRLPANTRLKSHVATLHALTDPSTFSTRNEEEAVADYDDRTKRAGAKTKVVQRMVDAGTKRGGGTETGKGKGKKVEESMEDFSGSQFLR